MHKIQNDWKARLKAKVPFGLGETKPTFPRHGGNHLEETVTICSVRGVLAVEFAEESGQTLIGFLRGDTMNVYAHPERVAP